jgi:hypothetical protein
MKTRVRVPRLIVSTCAGWLLLFGVAHAQTVFSSSVDRFELDGNPLGLADGTLDFVDEFDDGTIAPHWTPLLGTAVEADGVVTLRDPGTVILGLDVSNIELEGDIDNGAGDFTASTYWVPAVPLPDREFHFQLYTLGALIESAGLNFNNLTVATPPAIAGPSITCQLTQIDGQGFHSLSYATVPVDPQAITGQIVFRLALDDATDHMTCSFSLDGGATFQSFAPIPVFVGVSSGEFLIGAGSTGGGGPPPPPTQQLVGTKQLLVKNASAPSGRRVVYQVKEPRGSGHALVGDPRTGGATLHVQLDGVAQCFAMPASGWSGSGLSLKYADPFGASGPVSAAQLKSQGGGSVSIKVVVTGRNGAVNLVPPNPGVQADTHLSIGGGDEYCGSTAGGTLKPNTAKVFKGKNAPAPAACDVGPC